MERGRWDRREEGRNPGAGEKVERENEGRIMGEIEREREKEGEDEDEERKKRREG